MFFNGRKFENYGKTVLRQVKTHDKNLLGGKMAKVRWRTDNKKKRWSHECAASATQPLTTSWQTPVCLYIYVCFPPSIFTSCENTIKSQQKPQGSSIRFIRLRVKPGYMRGAKKNFNAQNVIISVGEPAGESILCSASTVGSFTKLQSALKKKKKKSHGLLTLQHQTTGSDVNSCLF